jgi:peptide/nickel transport system ATP-binding protein
MSQPLAEPAALLRVEDLRITVGGGRAEAVHGVSFEVGKGETVGLVGESGSGKTLTCRAILGVLAPGCAVSGGQIEFDSTDLVTASKSELSRIRSRHIGAVFQDPASYLNPSLTIGRQLVEVLRVKNGQSRKTAHSRALELLELVGLSHPARVFRQYPFELSGGMLQRALLAIAVSCDPELLVADEATTALDVTVQAEVIDLLQNLRRELGLSIVFVSHDLAVISQLCDRIVVFYAGEAVESGDTRDVLSAPRHRYTRALLDVADTGGWEHRRLAVIPGQPPGPDVARSGCAFADRCPAVAPDCRSGLIPFQVSGDRGFRCLHPVPAELASAATAIEGAV